MEIKYESKCERRKTSAEKVNSIIEFAGPLIESIKINFFIFAYGEEEITLKFETENSYKHKAVIQLPENSSQDYIIDLLARSTGNIKKAKILHIECAKNCMTKILKTNKNLRCIEAEDVFLRAIFQENVPANSVEKLQLEFSNYNKASLFKWVLINFIKIFLKIILYLFIIIFF